MKFKIITGATGINGVIYRANSDNDIIESDIDLSKRDGIEKYMEVKKKVINIDDGMTPEEILELRAVAKELGIRSAHNMKVENLIIKIAEKKVKEWLE